MARDSLEALLNATRDAALAFRASLSSRPAGRRPVAPAPLTLPEEGLGDLEALALFRERYEAQLSGSAGPRYLGFVTGGSTPAALAGDWLAAAYDQNLSNDGDSIATFVERETLTLLRELFGLPAGFEGAFVSGATQANLVCLATARQWAGTRLGVDVAEQGMATLPAVAVLGAAPHASVYKALSALGWGRAAVELVPTLPGRPVFDLGALADRLRSLRGQPVVVLASAGEVNTGDFDDLAALAELCHSHQAWLHVDAAFGLFAACDPERAPWLTGIECADSIASDAHKWLNVPYDSGFYFTRHLALTEQVFRATAAYLGAGPDLLHRTPENSRRFRALPAWMTLLAHGRAGYRAIVETNCARAVALGQALERSGHYELLAPVRLNIVCFAPKAGDAARRDAILGWLVADGRVFLTPTQYAGRPGLRAAFSNATTTAEDVEVILEALEAAVS
jgi:glutamate/tyrosine decarboxylase-like PLP-dependent enzyme